MFVVVMQLPTQQGEDTIQGGGKDEMGSVSLFFIMHDIPRRSKTKLDFHGPPGVTVFKFLIFSRCHFVSVCACRI